MGLICFWNSKSNVLILILWGFLLLRKIRSYKDAIEKKNIYEASTIFIDLLIKILDTLKKIKRRV